MTLRLVGGPVVTAVTAGLGELVVRLSEVVVVGAGAVLVEGLFGDSCLVSVLDVELLAPLLVGGGGGGLELFFGPPDFFLLCLLDFGLLSMVGCRIIIILRQFWQMYSRAVNYAHCCIKIMQFFRQPVRPPNLADNYRHADTVPLRYG